MKAADVGTLFVNTVEGALAQCVSESRHVMVNNAEVEAVSRNEFTEPFEFRRVVKRHGLLRHPFLEAARHNTLTEVELRRFAIQEMFVSLAFPAMMAEVVSKIPCHLEAVRYPLVVNMYEEVGENDPEKSHANLLRKLAVALGATQKELAIADPLPETVEYLERIFTLCRSRAYIQGLGAVGFGNEYLVLLEYPLLKAACRRVGCPQDVLGFFDVNIKADITHTERIEKVLVAACIRSDQVRLVTDAIAEALHARELFYDGLWRVTDRA